MPFSFSMIVTRRCTMAVASTLFALLAPVVARAQVGYLPNRSPYEDLVTNQSLSLNVGRLATNTDPANVHPKSSALYSLLYTLPVGGPASLFVQYGFAPSTRNLFNPEYTAKTRLIGQPSVTTHLVNLGLDVSMTGQKTFHRFMPSLTGGIGVASDFAKADTGAYKFGTKFSFSYGAALKYFLRNGWALRADVTNNVWQYQYPDRYFVKSSDTTSILTDTKNRSAWRSNWALTAGVSVPLFR
jgi:hypothetical protein